MKFFIPLLLLLITSCGPAYVSDPLRKYFDNFLDEAKKRDANLPGISQLLGVYTDTDLGRDLPAYNLYEEKRLGTCYRTLAGNTVIVRESLLSDACELQVLVFHELGHCLLYKDHIDDGGLHIMNSKMEPVCAVYWYYWDTLLDELFAKTKAINFKTIDAASSK